jgi:hypothetical protein
VSEVDLIGPEATPPSQPLPLPPGYHAGRRWQLQQVVIDQVIPPSGFRFTAAQLAQARVPVYLEPSVADQRWSATYEHALSSWISDLRAGGAGRMRLADALRDIASLTPAPTDSPVVHTLLPLIERAAASAETYSRAGDEISRSALERAIQSAVTGKPPATTGRR